MLASIFWAMAGDLVLGYWFERVSSQANISDKISRQDFSDVAWLQASHVPVSADADHDRQLADESVGQRAIDLLLTSSLP